MDRVVTKDIFVTLATRPDLQLLESQKVITAELMSSANSRRNQNYSEGRLYPQLHKLVCTGEIDGLVSLLSHLTQITYLETTILGSHVYSVGIHCLLPEIATYCPNLQFLQLENTAASAAQDISLSPNELVGPDSPKHFRAWSICKFQATMLELLDSRLFTLPKLLRPYRTSKFWC
jgi:hypothetical protein